MTIASIFIALMIYGCSWFQETPTVETEQVCRAVCGIKAVGGMACNITVGDYWGVLGDSVDLATCLHSCKSNFNLFAEFNPVCLNEIYVGMESGGFGCPEIEYCLD